MLLSSCRTEELLHEAEQKEELSKKFITFTKKHENDVIDYGEGFKSLALRYDSIHKTNMTGRADIAKLEEELQTNNKMSFSTSNEVAYIDFNVRSQLMEEENGNKWMVFPRVKGKEVVDLVMAILSEEETLLGYYTIDKESELYKENISKFEEVYEKKQQKNWNVKNYSYVPYFWEREIEEVIIINPRPLPRKPDLPNTGSPAPPSGIGIGVGFDGNCGAFASCGGGGSGTSTPPPPPDTNPNNNPCDSNKKIAVNNIVNSKNNELKRKTGEKKENGYTFDRNSDGSINTKPRDNTSINSDRMAITINPRTIGYTHTHIEKEGVVNMFSPEDISTFIEIVRNAKENNIPYSELFATMIFKQGGRHYVYQLTYTGNGNDLPNEFTKSQMDNFRNLYIDKASGYLEDGEISISNGQMLFFDILKDMGLKNIKLVDVSNPYKPEIIDNENGEPKVNPCI